MKTGPLQIELRKYEESFASFVKDNELPSTFFKAPDHFAIKCADELDYIETCTTVGELVDRDGLWEVPMDERLLGSAHLSGQVALAGYEFRWVEVMQPRPGKETEQGFVEHTEFYFPDFPKAEQLLQRCGVEFERQGNEGHQWINIQIDAAGREIKLNDRLLAEVVADERKRGILRPVKTEGRE